MENENNNNPSEEPVSGSGNLPKLNKTVAIEIAKAKHIVLNAQKEPLVTELAARGLDAEFFSTLETDIQAAIDLAQLSVSNTTLKEGATQNEHRLEEQLVEGIQEVQSAARQKYRVVNPEILPAYYIGEDLRRSAAVLNLVAGGVLSMIGEDPLPGFDQEKIDQFETLYLAWLTAEDVQGDRQAAATGTRAGRDNKVESVKNRRIVIQLAVNAQYPYQNKDNVAIRRIFLLPIDRPYTG